MLYMGMTSESLLDNCSHSGNDDDEVGMIAGGLQQIWPQLLQFLHRELAWVEDVYHVCWL